MNHSLKLINNDMHQSYMIYPYSCYQKFNVTNFQIHLSNKYKLNIMPLSKYTRYQKKKARYLKLYIQSKFQYYLIFNWKLFSKYVRKNFVPQVFNITVDAIIWYWLGRTGLLQKLFNGIRIRRNKLIK